VIKENNMSEKILENITKLAKENGYDLTKHAPKIAMAKFRFFGEDDWARCPCDPDSDRACISEHCHKDIATNGHCHCNCYCRKDME
jgi:hypothetical protein